MNDKDKCVQTNRRGGNQRTDNWPFVSGGYGRRARCFSSIPWITGAQNGERCPSTGETRYSREPNSVRLVLRTVWPEHALRKPLAMRVRNFPGWTSYHPSTTSCTDKFFVTRFQCRPRAAGTRVVPQAPTATPAKHRRKQPRRHPTMVSEMVTSAAETAATAISGRTEQQEQ